MVLMSKSVVVASCKANGGYAAPHLNDELFLHCTGFLKVENLDEYVNVKALWLEQNAISELSGLSAQQKLISLFVQSNTIHSMRTLSAPLTNLRVLNISHNYLVSLDGLAEGCPLLETLQASHNCIETLKACEDVWKLSNTLTSVDLSFNKIESYFAAPDAASAARSPSSEIVDANEVRVVDTASGDHTLSEKHSADTLQVALPSHNSKEASLLVVANFFCRVPHVSVIYMHGNAIVHGLRNYRRNMIFHLPALTYLDERPVFPEERRVVEAWGRNGAEGEAAARAAIRAEKKEALSSCVKVLTDRMDQNREVRDRLTRQWEQQQAAELALLKSHRQAQRDAQEALQLREQAARDALDRDWQNEAWDLGEAATAAHDVLLSQEVANRHAYEQRCAAEKATQEAQAEINQEAAAAMKSTDAAGSPATMSSTGASSRRTSASDANATLNDLLQSDDDVLLEMELQIQNVLHQLDSKENQHAGRSAGSEQQSSSSVLSLLARPSRADRTAGRVEREIHTAFMDTASRLQKERQRTAADLPAREAVWSQFDTWNQRKKATENKGQSSTKINP